MGLQTVLEEHTSDINLLISAANGGLFYNALIKQRAFKTVVIYMFLSIKNNAIFVAIRCELVCYPLMACNEPHCNKWTLVLGSFQ